MDHNKSKKPKNSQFVNFIVENGAPTKNIENLRKNKL